MKKTDEILTKIRELPKKIREMLKGKQLIKALIIFLVLTLFSVFVCLDFKINTENIVEKSYNVDLNTITAVNYSQVDGTFIPSGQDPQFSFAFSPAVVNTVLIKLSQPLNEFTFCQFYYHDEYGALQEERSVVKYGITGKDEIVFSFPEGSYSFFRVDVEGEFAIDAITMQKIVTNSHLSVAGFSVVWFILFLLLSCVLALLAVAYEKNILNFIRKVQEKPKFLRLCFSILFGLLVFHLLTAFWNQKWFVSDEAEIFMHGQAIANGELLYKDTASQHTPIMYYISAVFSLFGVSTITQFRLCFYGVMAALWALMYYRYSENRSRIAIILYPILYICTIAQLDFATKCILSDQFQGIGMAILFCEFLEFNEKRELSTSNCVMISLSILISFGTAFVSAFAICIMALTVVCLDVWGYIRNKVGIKQTWSDLWRRYLKLASIVLAPMLLICVFYVITGSFDDFIAWAYTINRTTYANYLGGYGTSIFSGFFGGRIHFMQLFQLNGINTLSFTKLFIFLMAISYVVYVSRKGNGPVIRVLGLVLFMFACATRGLFDFHGLSAIALLCVMSACFIGEGLVPAIKNRALPIAALLCSLAVIVLPYYQNLYPNSKKITSKDDIPIGSAAWYVDKITEDGERVGFSLLNCDIMVHGKVIPATVQAGSVPWFWDFAKEEAMAELNQDAPRVFLFSPTHEVWGHKITDYAPELVEFINNNYTSLDYVNQPTIWVHNSYIEEVNENINSGKYLE